MTKFYIDLVNAHRKSIGVIEWFSDGRISSRISSEEGDIASKVEEALRDAVANGIRSRSSLHTQWDGTDVIAEEASVVKADDERFPGSLADVLSKTDFGGYRVFAFSRRATDKDSEENL